jgi:hypothetical protein
MVTSIDDVVKSLRIAVDNIAGATASRTGPFIVGYIELEGPEFPNELFRQYNQAMEQVGRNLRVSNDEHIRKQVWFLKEVGVLEEVTTEFLALDPHAERDEFDKRYYDMTDEVDMGWLEEEPESIALGLVGREGGESLYEAIGQPVPADIPSEILNPQRAYYEENNPESAYLEGR